MIKEITASQLLQEELAKSDLNLVGVHAFMNKVCGLDSGTQKLKEAALCAIQKRDANREELLPIATIAAATETGAEATVPVSQPCTTETANIPATGEDESRVFATGAPVGNDVTAIAAVEDKSGKAEAAPAGRTNAPRTVICDVTAEPSGASVEVEGGGAQEHDETDVISLVETVMSVGGSSSDGDRSPSTCGSSVSTSGTRKRMVEGSPERECGEGSRREFPSRVTRSAGGCRVYVPSVRDDRGDCPGRVLNDDGTFATFVTIGQGCASTGDEQAGSAARLLISPIAKGVIATDVSTVAGTLVAPTRPVTTVQSSSTQHPGCPDIRPSIFKTDR